MILLGAALPLLRKEIPGNRIEGMVKLICLQIVGGILCIISISHRGHRVTENVMKLNFT